MKKFLISLFVFLPPLFLINDVDAACARFKAKIWTNNLQTNKKGIPTDGFMYSCSNIYKFNEGAKNDVLSIRFWSCLSEEGCGQNFKKGYSAISLNNMEWVSGIISYASYKNGLEGHILCVKRNGSVIEYCWQQGDYFWWEGKP